MCKHVITWKNGKAPYFYIVVLEGHEEGEEGFGRDPEGLQQVSLLEYPGDDDIVIMLDVDDDEENNGDSKI